MSKRYEPQNIEKKWQKIWQDEKAFAATDDIQNQNIMHSLSSRIRQDRDFT